MGSLSPVVAETGETIVALFATGDGDEQSVTLVLSGDVPAGTRRLHLGGNSIALSAFFRSLQSGRTFFTLQNAQRPAWLLIAFPGTYAIRLSAT